MVRGNTGYFIFSNDGFYTRVAYLVFSGLLFSAAPAVWVTLGYLDPAAWFLEWSDIVLASVLMIVALIDRNAAPVRAMLLAFISMSLVIISLLETSYYPTFILLTAPVMVTGFVLASLRDKAKYASISFLLMAVAALAIMGYFYLSVAPAIPTDETLLTLYAAHAFSHGLNPYSTGVMNGAFSFYKFPLYLGTPFTTGGFVHSITYPALSFIIQIPSAVYGFPTSYLMVPFLLLPAFLIWFKVWAKGNWRDSIFVLFPLLSLIIYPSQASNADLNPVWASLIMISYFVLPRAKLSGAFLGLSLAVKQLPIFSVPFFLYFIYREYGNRKATLWALSALAAFLVVNGYFMLQGFAGFLTSILQDEVSPMLGVGLGPSQLSYLGILPLGSMFFTAVTFLTFAAAIVIYVWKYQHAKYALFAFPAIILFFNYRYFEQYSFYWLILSLLPLADFVNKRADKQVSIQRKRTALHLQINIKNLKKLAIIVIVVLISGTLVVHFAPQKKPSYFQINSVTLKNVNSSGYVNSMTVNIWYEGETDTTTHVLFRIITPGRIANANMFIWEPSNNTAIQSGQDYVLTIHPIYSEYAFKNTGTFRLVAYFGAIQGVYVYS